MLKAAEGPGLSNGTGGWARRFVYSGEGDLLRRDDSIRGTAFFEHDEAHRLCKTRSAEGTVQEYAYDRAGNLLKAPGLAARVQAGNRLLEANGDQFSYDERDNLAQRQGPAGITRYTYDSRDLLKTIEGPGISYQAKHDGLGRRTLKTVNGQTWQYYWDSDRLAAEIFPDGRLRVYVYPDATALVPILFLEYDSVDAEPESGKRYHVYTDHLGCPELVLDDAGKTVWRARIDPYGTAHVDVGADFHQPLRWPGHTYDAETGLHDNRFRTYSPELGRYLQSDPAGTEGGINLYAYTENPLRAVDLDGLKACKAAKAAAKAAKKAKKDEKGKNKEGAKKPGKDKGKKEKDKVGRDDVYPGKFRKSTHDAMAMKYTKEGKKHVDAHKANPDKVPAPPPVRADGGTGEVLRRDQMTWKDADGKKIDYYARDDAGNIKKDSNGRPITNLTYDHDPPMVDRYNQKPNGGHNQTSEQRADSFNDPNKLKPMSRSQNSSKGGGTDEAGKRTTYTSEKGPNFT